MPVLECNFPGARVLVVEDNPVNQMVLEAMLAAIEVESVLADDGSAAIELLKSVKEGELDVIFMDCQMPILDGYEATTLIRAGQAGAQHTDIPVIALTAHAMQGDREKCLQAGMNEYLTKPIDRQALSDILRYYL